jgi:uncharacterized membrane protein
MAWHRHPGVRSGDQLTLGERSADRMRNSMGSWAFVFGALAFLALWMLYNRNSGFDPYPFILLNLVLSCLAAMQGAILLIAAKRSDQISSELAAARLRDGLPVPGAAVDAADRLRRAHQAAPAQNVQLAEALALLKTVAAASARGPETA